MLVLTRKLQEQIRIGDNVTITVLRVKGQAVRIGIEAPRDVRVVRGELPREGQAAPSEDSAECAAKPAAGISPGRCRPAAESDGGEESVVSHRLPQRRAINRYGQPPLRLAASHALATATG